MAYENGFYSDSNSCACDLLGEVLMSPKAILLMVVGILCLFPAGCAHNPISNYRVHKKVSAMSGFSAPYMDFRI